MRTLIRGFAGLLILAVTLGLLGAAVVGLRDAMRADGEGGGPKPRQKAERAVAAQVIRIMPARIQPVIRTWGHVRSRRTLDVRTVIGGTVVEVGPGVVDGARIEAGDLVARLDPTSAENALATARLDVADAEAELAEAGKAIELARAELAEAAEQATLRARALERTQTLRRRAIGSDAAVDEAEAALVAARLAELARKKALAEAEARRDRARVQLERRRLAEAEARRRLAETEIRSTLAGNLADVSVAPGRVVAPNERLARVIDPDALEVVFDLTAAEFRRVADLGGAPLPLALRAHLAGADDGPWAAGHLSRAGAEAPDGASGRRLYAEIDRAEGLRDGDLVAVEVVEPPLDNVVSLPASALGADGTVLVLGPDGRLAVASVELLRRQGDDVIVRAPGLEGQEVVARRTPLLGPGILVQPIRGNAPEARPDRRQGRADAPGARRIGGVRARAGTRAAD